MASAGKREDERGNPSSSDLGAISPNDIRDVVKLSSRVELHRLYGELGINDKQVEISEQNANSTDFDRKGKQVLMDWRQRKGRAATRNGILQALLQCELNATREELQDKWEPKEESCKLVPYQVNEVTANDTEASTTKRAVSTHVQPAPPAINLGQSNVANVDNRQYHLSQQFTPHPDSHIGTMIGGSHNLNLSAEGSTVNIYQNAKPCYIPPKQSKVEDSDSSDIEDDIPKGARAIPPMAYNRLIWEVFIEPMEDNERLFRRAKYFCRQDWSTQNGISSRKIKKLDPEHFVKYLEKCQLLSPQNLDFLLDLLNNLEQAESVRKIMAFMEFHMNDSLTSYRPNGTVANGKFHAEIVKDGDISQEHVHDVNRLKTVFNEKLELPKSAVNFTGSGSGSVVLVFLLPRQWSTVDNAGNRCIVNILEKMQEAVRNRANWLLAEGIIGIHIEGTPYVDLKEYRHEDVSTIGEVSMLSDISDSEDDEKYVGKTSLVASESESGSNVKEKEKEVKDSPLPSGHLAIIDVKERRKKPSQSLALLGASVTIFEDETAEDSALDEKEHILTAGARSSTQLGLYKAVDSFSDSGIETSVSDSASVRERVYQTAVENSNEQQMSEILEKYKNIEHRVRLLESNEVRYIPSTLKTYVRDLQWEIKKTADTVAQIKTADRMAQLDLMDLAIKLYSRALTVGHFARNIGYTLNITLNRNIILARVKCALTLANLSTDIEQRLFLYDKCFEDCQLVRSMDSSDIRSQIFMVATLHGLMQCQAEEDSVFSTICLMRCIETLPQEHHTHPMVKDLITSVKSRYEQLDPSIQDIQHTGTGEQQKCLKRVEKVEIRRKLGTKGRKRSKKHRARARQCDSGFDTGAASTTSEDQPKHSRRKSKSRPSAESESGLGSELCTQASSDSDTDALGCSYCQETFVTEEALTHHITTPEHKTKLNSDQERPWKHRSPPLNVINGNYRLCARFFKGKCPFSKVNSASNSCANAHSKEELLEWKDRHKYRKMKMLKASQKKMFSFVDDLRTDYYLAENQLEVMTAKAPTFVEIEYQPPCLKASIESSDATDSSVYKYHWDIAITMSTMSQERLKRIGLLHDIYRPHFYITHPANTNNPQICQEDQMPSRENEDGCKKYTIGVNFTTRMLGKYEQWIVFDFGVRPVVFQKMTVRVGSLLDGTDDTLLSDNTSQTWDASNCNIVSFNRFQSRLEKKLESKYRMMDLPKEPGILNSENYKHFMHYMLTAEEHERTDRLKRFGMEVQMTPKQTFHLKSPDEVMTFVAEKGQQFGKIDLTHALHDDTSASQIVITSVQYIYIKFDEKSDTVYEADIFKDREMEEKQTKDELFVVLSERCVRDMELTNGQTRRVQIQFQLDRRHFLWMHHAVDRLTIMDYLFPPENPNPALICPQEHIADCSSQGPTLNKWQEAAARFISSKGGSRDQTPLLLLYGPFGTGKTFTIATGVMDTLLKKRTASHARGCPRILICTHSNSAADLYIIRYFHAFVKSCMATKYRVKIRRVYATTRDIRSIPKTVLAYTNIERGRLKVDLEDIRRCHVVITTTSTAGRLQDLPKGHFTHILLDEAGQILETEAIIPLTLAKQHTCVVLAGDHVQMGPVVYSAEAKALNFDHSLLERLFEYSSSNNCHRHIILSDNYRSCKEILKFLSKMFYHAKHLQALGVHHALEGHYPLEFRAVMGDDECLGNSYVNNFEADEIAKRLKELERDWPTVWGKFKQSDIGVLTPYTLQVRRIRKLLKIIGFGDVTVERVQNVQGKEYRIVFISTVRTRHTVTVNNSDECDQYLGFLSDIRQLNTAFTRAKSLVVVVGNPVALCSVGKCCKVWQNYVVECEENGSLYGVKNAMEIEYAIQSVASSSRQEGYTGRLKSTESTLESFQSSTGDVDRIALEDTPQLRLKSELTDTWVAACSSNEEGYSLLQSKGAKPTMKMWKAQPEVSDTSTTSESEVEGIDLLRELRRESRRRHETLGTSDISESESETDPGDFRMVDEEDGHVRVERMSLQDVEAEEKDEKPSGIVKKCKFRVDYDGKRYAVPIDDPVGSEEILISTNSQRKTALDGDEISVEIIDDLKLVGTDAEQQDDNEEHHTHGRVLQVLARAEEMEGKEIVCFPDRFADNLMVPVDRTMPKIFILRPKEDRRKKRNERVLTIPICRFRNKRTERIRDVVVASKDRANKLFVIRWVSWEERFYYPLGLVIDELPKNINEETGLDTLKRIFYVPEELDNEDIDQAAMINLSQHHHGRKDCKAEHVITIDPETAEDFDDALSVSELPDGSFDIHIHIADVTHFVQKDDPIDKEARERVTSYYPDNNDPIHMLPPILSTDLCSFKKGEDRLAISIFATVSADGVIIEQPQIVSADGVIIEQPQISKTIVCCKHQLTYCEAEQIIEKGETVGMEDCTRESVVLLLHRVATSIRCCRLGSQRFALNLEGDSARTPQAHILVQEMMILANQIVGKFLVEKYPNKVPLRRQMPPESKKLRYWHDTYNKSIASSQYLSEEHAYLNRLVNEELTDMVEVDDEDTIDIQKTAWSKIQSMNLDDANDKRAIAASVTSVQNHPQIVPALSALHHIMRKADYVCSGEFENDKLAHTALHMGFYTHFTSPIRRYIDIIVHRTLKAALAADEHPPYGLRDVSDVCHLCSVQSRKAKDFQNKTRALQLALDVRQSPISVLSVVESVSKSNMMVGFSLYPMISYANRRSDIVFKLLKPFGRPDVDDEKKHARVNWKERIFNVQSTRQMSKDDIKGNRLKNVELDTKRFVIKMSASRWLAMQESINQGDAITLRRLIQEEEEAQREIEIQDESVKPHEGLKKAHPVVTEVTCELGLEGNVQKGHHYVEFKREFSPGDVVQVQLQSGLQRGLMSPKVALVNVTPMLNFCAEHRHEAVECFAEMVDRRPSREDIKTYQKTWLPIIDMMTAYNAVYGNDTVILHGVKIEWQQRSEDALPCGSFNLSSKFCTDRHIKILSPKGTGLRYDYLCIRYTEPKGRMSFTSGSHNLLKYDSVSSSEYQQATFVAHGYVVDTNADDEDSKGNPSKQPDFLTVFFEVHHCSSPFPIQLLANSGEEAHGCTVEIIPKAVPDRRIERAVQLLDKAPEMIQDICLLKPPNTTGEDNKGPEEVDLDYLEIKESPFPSLNKSQKKALHNALTRPFTVIQGPPGTGKTMTGACLVHFFTKENKKLRNTGKGRPQVLYCGPSNKSVDVIADYLKRFKHIHKLSIVRVYSESIEYKDFPPPVEPGPRRKLEADDVKMDPELEDISLHYRIRRPPNTFAEVICSFERQFGPKSGKIPPNEDDFTKYRKNIQLAEREELGAHQVILCTCNTSGQYRIKKFTNIVQCIVDEAGMCNEPETIIPLVSTKPKQIVLVGDHKQLRPIIQENTAQQLGMDISLLERYSKDMEMLDTQYRMHIAICEFPSKAFYNGLLKTDEMVTPKRAFFDLRYRWPGGVRQPTVFCHIIGKEETLSVLSEEGNEMSKANRQEVTQVVRIARTLVNHYKVQPKKVVILTQYQLQRRNIQLLLKSKKAEDIDVHTVIKSQGSEWDFVIISNVRSLPRVEIEENSTYGWRKHNLGFITDDNQMNVALTRAKKGLIIVGNKFLLQTDKRWKELLDYYEKKNCVILANEFLPPKRKR